MSEIKTTDFSELNTNKMDGFHQIKPEQGTTLDKAKSFVDGLFSHKSDSPDALSSDEKIFKDDNGKVYRIGDRLEPNKTFDVNGYTYKTDRQGRVISTEGQLRLRKPEYVRKMDSMETVGKGDQKENDERGHSIGHQFEGSGGMENLTAMSKELNHGDYSKMENKLADAIKAGDTVHLKVNPVYSRDSYRPTKYRVSYSIDGHKTAVTFRN